MEAIAVRSGGPEHARMHTANDSGPARSRISTAAAFGVLFGGSGWALGFALLVLAQGSWVLLLESALPVLLSALAVSLLLLSLVQWKVSLPARAVGGQLLLTGGISTAVGLSLVIADGYVTPVLESNARLADLVRSAGGTLRLPIHFALGALAVGCVLLAIALRRIARAK